MRPASMDSAESQPPSSVCKPKSPNATVFPRQALPFTLPRWFFLNFTRLGICGIGVVLLRQVVAVVHPALNADIALSSTRFGKAVFHFCPQGRERDAPSH